MMGVDVDVTLDRQASTAVRQAHRRRLRDSADKGFAVSQREVPEDRGTLRQSGVPPTWDGDTLVWGYRGVSYIRPMEFGTEPYWPPARPLVEWADRVLGDPSLGYAVQRKIAREGIDAQPYVRPGREAQIRWLRSHPFGRYLSDALE